MMMTYHSNIFQEIKSIVSINDILNIYNVQIERNGFIFCPFHQEKTPSAKIKNNYFHCFGCDLTLGIFDFVSKIDNISTYQALIKIDSLFSLNMVENNEFSSFDKLTYSIKQKEKELSKLEDLKLIGKCNNNGIMKLETELKKMKENLFKNYGNDLDLFFQKMVVRKCNMKN
jgi:DNA primase